MFCRALTLRRIPYHPWGSLVTVKRFRGMLEANEKYLTTIKTCPSQQLLLIIMYGYVKYNHKKTRLFKIFVANSRENAAILTERLKQTSVIYCWPQQWLKWSFSFPVGIACNKNPCRNGVITLSCSVRPDWPWSALRAGFRTAAWKRGGDLRQGVVEGYGFGVSFYCITVSSAKWCGCSESQIPVCEMGLLLPEQCCFQRETQCPTDSTDSRSYTDPPAEAKVEGANVFVGSTQVSAPCLVFPTPIQPAAHF